MHSIQSPASVLVSYPSGGIAIVYQRLAGMTGRFQSKTQVAGKNCRKNKEFFKRLCCKVLRMYRSVGAEVIFTPNMQAGTRVGEVAKE